MTTYNTATPAPVPTPFCPLYAPLLPLLGGDLLDGEQASEVHDHVSTCAWCQAQCATYAVVDDALRRHFTSAQPAITKASEPPPTALPPITLEQVQHAARYSLPPQAAFTRVRVPSRQPARTDRALRAAQSQLSSFASVAAVVLIVSLTVLLFAVHVSQSGDQPTGPTPVIPTCVVLTQGKHICEFALPTPNSQPGGIVRAADGSVWFTEQMAGQIGRLTPAGVISEFTLSGANRHPVDIAAGPDNAIWFTEQTAGTIGRITPGGSISEFPLPTDGLYARSITAGPDGAVWFGEVGNVNLRGSDKIGRITPGGQITEFALSQQGEPGEMTFGPGGDLWYIWHTSQGSQLGHMTPSGTVLPPVSVSATDEQLTGITTGSDGNLWVTASGSNAILRVTPGGTVTRFTIPTPNSGVMGIAAGPDNALWFVEQLSNTIGRITTVGSISTYAVPRANSAALNIAAAPDGSIWFTELSGNAIGRIA
ncbi:MAG TPA: hypothetical protein VF510_20250 [Ktedonobacterales bacterium]